MADEMNVDIDPDYANWPKRTPDTLDDLEKEEGEVKESAREVDQLLWEDYP